MYKMQPHKIEKGLTDINGCLVNYLENVLDKDSSLFQPDLRSHFYELDSLTNGFAPANLIAIASRPGMGKSSFALTIAENVTRYSNKSVAFFSLNRSRAKLVQQLISRETNIEVARIATSRITENESQQLIKAIALYKSLPLFICDAPNITVDGIRTEIVGLQNHLKQKELGLIVVDCLQSVTDNSCTNSTEQLSKIVRKLKQLAKEFHVPILMLSEVNRSVDTRIDKRPRLTDLSACGSIEDIGDLVLMIYRENYYNSHESDSEIAELIIAKHRLGANGTIKLLYDNSLNVFRNLPTSTRLRPSLKTKLKATNQLQRI
jgi:replicative DNA helicase